MSALHETSDDYGCVISSSGRWRVIRCKDDLQYIVQKRAGGARPRPWEAKAYILNASALCPVLDRASMGIPPDDRARLTADLVDARAIEAV
jgi:hypothetical protein